MSQVNYRHRFEVRGDVAIIFLYYKGSYVECQIDTGDLEKASSIRGTWTASWHSDSQTFYVQFVADGILLHRLLTDAPKGLEVDHKNHNGLDNRVSTNLRVVSSDDNKFNRRGIQGGGKNPHRNVYWHAFSKSWHVQIKRQRKYYSYGYFQDVQEAIKVADEKRLLHA